MYIVQQVCWREALKWERVLHSHFMSNHHQKSTALVDLVIVYLCVILRESDFQFSKLYGFRLEPHNIIKVRQKASLMPMHASFSPCLGTRLVKGAFLPLLSQMNIHYAQIYWCFLSQSCTLVLLRVVCTNMIYTVIIFKALVDMLQGTHMSILGMNGFVQFAQRMTSVIWNGSIYAVHPAWSISGWEWTNCCWVLQGLN